MKSLAPREAQGEIDTKQEAKESDYIRNEG
jgi:hypothetical protein